MKRDGGDGDRGTMALAEAASGPEGLARDRPVRREIAVEEAIAHELKRPLGRIFLELEEIQSRSDLNDPHNLKRRIQVVAEQVRDMGEIFDAILDISRIRSGLCGAPGELHDLAAILVDALCLHRIPLRQLDRSGANRGLCVRGDRRQLLQAFCNILENALRYGGPASGLDVSIESGMTATRVVIADRGPGIPAHMRHAVFEKFVRLDMSDRRGSGLGLALVKAIIEAHGGSVALEDNKPGLRVVVVLPVAEMRAKGLRDSRMRRFS